MPDQFFGTTEQFLFTRALSLAEHEGKTIHLAMVAANDVWDAILRATQSLESSAVVLGLSAKMAITEEARRRRRRMGKASRTETSCDAGDLHPDRGRKESSSSVLMHRT